MTREGRSLAMVFSAALLIALATMTVALLVLLSIRNNQIIDRIEARALQGRAEMIANHLRHDANGEWRLNLPSDVAAAFSIVYGRAAYAVVDAQGKLILGAGTSVPLAEPLPAGSRRPVPFQVERGNAVFTGLAMPAQIDGVPVSIQVAEDEEHPDVLLDDARNGFALGVGLVVMLPVLIALAAVAMVVMHRLVQPVRLLAERAERLDPSRPAERLAEADVPSEILPLVRAVNSMLSRLQAARETQRAFTADAAHEFRTPLAVLRARIELLTDRDTATLLGADLSVFERLVAQLLAIAELDDTEAVPDAALNVSRLVREVAAFVLSLADQKRVSLLVELPPEPVILRAHEEALSQAVMNLLENAIGHAPEEGVVRLTLHASGEIEVADSGPGVPEQDREAVFRRFWRARRRIASQRRGSGLGLAIVQRAADIHHGSVEVGVAPEGGALFRLRLGEASLPRPAEQQVGPPRRGRFAMWHFWRAAPQRD